MSHDRQGAGAPNFTPGPWEVSHQNGDPYESFNGIIGPAQTNRLGKEYRTYVAQYVEPKNAHLIASALDLYDALEAMRAEFRAADRDAEWHVHAPDERGRPGI